MRRLCLSSEPKCHIHASVCPRRPSVHAGHGTVHGPHCPRMCFFRDPREGGRKQCVFEAFQNALCLQLDGGKGKRKRTSKTHFACDWREGRREGAVGFLQVFQNGQVPIFWFVKTPKTHFAWVGGGGEWLKLRLGLGFRVQGLGFRV